MGLAVIHGQSFMLQIKSCVAYTNSRLLLKMLVELFHLKYLCCVLNQLTKYSFINPNFGDVKTLTKGKLFHIPVQITNTKP